MFYCFTRGVMLWNTFTRMRYVAEHIYSVSTAADLVFMGGESCNYSFFQGLRSGHVAHLIYAPCPCAFGYSSPNANEEHVFFLLLNFSSYQYETRKQSPPVGRSATSELCIYYY